MASPFTSPPSLAVGSWLFRILARRFELACYTVSRRHCLTSGVPYRAQMGFNQVTSPPGHVLSPPLPAVWPGRPQRTSPLSPSSGSTNIHRTLSPSFVIRCTLRSCLHCLYHFHFIHIAGLDSNLRAKSSPQFIDGMVLTHLLGMGRIAHNDA